MKKIILGFSFLIVAALIAAFLLVQKRDSSDQAQAMAQSGLSCSAFHSGLNSPFEKASCLLPDGKVMKDGDELSGYEHAFALHPQVCGDPVVSRCVKGGQFEGPSPLFAKCQQLCVHPNTNQPVVAGTVYKYFNISAGTQAQCDQAFRQSTCDQETGQFTPSSEEKRFSSCAVLKASGTQVLRWSDPNTWGGKIPEAGASVVIPDGKVIILDQDTAALSLLQIDGILAFANQDLTVTTAAIYMGGSLQIGSPSAPFNNEARVHIIQPPAGSKIRQGLYMVSGGQFDVHGIALTDEEKMQGGAYYQWGATRYSNIKLEVDSASR